MASYQLKKLSESVYAISLARQKIGQVVRKHDGSGWYGCMQAGKDRVEATKASASEAFQDLVAQANRIAICGRNNREAALAALAKRNAEMEKAQAAFEASPEAEIFRDIERVAASLNLPLRMTPRIRRRKIRL